jgi:hypothetical protein
MPTVKELIKMADAAITPPKIQRLKRRNLLSFGHTLLNLGCSGKYYGGLAKGTVNLFVGDSDSGKSVLTCTCFAEAMLNKYFDDYRFIHWAIEPCELDFTQVFGEEVAARIEWPCVDERGNPHCPNTVEAFYSGMRKILSGGKPVIAVLDSQSALKSASDEARRSKRAKSGKSQQDYKTGKASAHSDNLFDIEHLISRTNSILIIINQTRANIVQGFGAAFAPKTTYSGGFALKFASKVMLWSSVSGKIESHILNRDRNQGTLCKIEIKKNHLIGGTTEKSVLIPIFDRTGIDDIGSCIHYLCEEGYWDVKKTTEETETKKTKYGKFLAKKIEAEDFDFSGRVTDLADKIFEEGRERELQKLCQTVFDSVQEASTLKRRKKYR